MTYLPRLAAHPSCSRFRSTLGQPAKLGVSGSEQASHIFPVSFIQYLSQAETSVECAREAWGVWRQKRDFFCGTSVSGRVWVSFECGPLRAPRKSSTLPRREVMILTGPKQPYLRYGLLRVEVERIISSKIYKRERERERERERDLCPVCWTFRYMQRCGR
jgi:hypothetical protein